MKTAWEQLIDLLGDAIHIADASPLPVESPGKRAGCRRHRLLSITVLALLTAIPLALMAWYFG